MRKEGKGERTKAAAKGQASGLRLWHRVSNDNEEHQLCAKLFVGGCVDLREIVPLQSQIGVKLLLWCQIDEDHSGGQNKTMG